MAMYQNIRPVELLIGAAIFMHAMHAIIHTAQPAPPLWPRRTAAPVNVHLDLTDRPRLLRAPQPAQATVSGERVGRRGGGATRRRGRRGGVNWSRHGDTGRNHYIIGHLNIQSLKSKLPDLRNTIDGTYGFDILSSVKCGYPRTCPTDS